MMPSLIEDLQTFKFEAYVKLLKRLKQRYKIVPFCEVKDEDKSFLILRHDIDASIKVALKMARLERRLGVRSTYFVMFSNKLYNVLEKDNLEALRNLVKLGHEIGLHYDVPTYEKYGRDLRETLETEIALLERLIAQKVFSIAPHNVSLMTGEDPFKNIVEYMNVYAPRFHQNYVSDSCRAWYPEHLGQLLNFKHEKIQVLIHPFLWTEKVCKLDDAMEMLFQDIEEGNRVYKRSWLKMLKGAAKMRIRDGNRRYDGVSRKNRVENE
jgi:hypothetical protein